MGQSPKQLCRRCNRGIVDPTTRTCNKCGKIPTHGWKDGSRRGNRHKRGYDDAWMRLAAAYKAQHPFCEECLARGKYVPMDEVHHKTPFNGLADPLRLEWSNLQSLCQRCHARHTQANSRKSSAVPLG